MTLSSSPEETGRDARLLWEAFYKGWTADHPPVYRGSGYEAMDAAVNEGRAQPDLAREVFLRLLTAEEVDNVRRLPP